MNYMHSHVRIKCARRKSLNHKSPKSPKPADNYTAIHAIHTRELCCCKFAQPTGQACIYAKPVAQLASAGRHKTGVKCNQATTTGAGVRALHLLLSCTLAGWLLFARNFVWLLVATDNKIKYAGTHGQHRTHTYIFLSWWPFATDMKATKQSEQVAVPNT